MSHKAAKKSIAKLISQLCGESQSAVACQGKTGTFKSHRGSCGHQTGWKRSLRKSRLFNVWQYYTHVLLVCWCRHQMARKSMPWNCAYIRHLLANLVTYVVDHYPCRIHYLQACIDRHTHMKFCGLHTGQFNEMLTVNITTVYDKILVRSKLWQLVIVGENHQHLIDQSFLVHFV